MLLFDSVVLLLPPQKHKPILTEKSKAMNCEEIPNFFMVGFAILTAKISLKFASHFFVETDRGL